MKNKIYIDPLLKAYVVPKELRNNSKSDGIIFTPGTRIPLSDDVKFIRLFTAWYSLDHSRRNIDVDLSAAFIKKDADRYISEEVYFGDPTNEGAVHSGDLTFSKEYSSDKSIGAEFIDLDIEILKEKGHDFVLILNNIYAGAPNWDGMNIFTGVQLLNEVRVASSKEINLSDNLLSLEIEGKGSQHIPIIYDFKENEIIIVDKQNEIGNYLSIVNLISNAVQFEKLYMNAVERQANMYDLLELYAKANDLEIVERKEAGTIFTYIDQVVEENQKLYNISHNIEEILGLLN